MSNGSLTTRVLDALAALEAAAAEAPGQGFGTRDATGAELIELARLSEQAGRLADALRTEVAHEIDARTSKRAPEDPRDSLAHSYGFSSSLDLLQHVTLVSRATASQRIRLGKACRTQSSLLGEELPGTFPHVGDAFFSGTLGIDTAEVVTRMLGGLPPSVSYEHRELAERNLVSHATGQALAPGVWEDSAENPHAGAPGLPVSTRHVAELAQGWIAALDQDGTLPRDEVLNRRFFRVGDARNGLVPVRGALLPETAAALNRIFDAINNPRAADMTGYRSGGGDQTHSSSHDIQEQTELSDGTRESRVRFVPEESVSVDRAKDQRSADQKRHDALATIFQIAMKHQDMPTMNGEALTLTIQVTEHELLKERGGTAWINDRHGGLTPVAAGAARHAACSGSVLRVTQNPQGRIIALDTTARIFNAHQRRAIMLRDGGCIIPGCGQPAAWCEIHHVTEWRNGGKTHTDNGVALCWFHHRHLETHGWNIRMRDGIPQVKAPPWLDPEQAWRDVRPLHTPPRIPSEEHPPKRSAKTKIIACETRLATCISAPKTVRHGSDERQHSRQKRRMPSVPRRRRTNTMFGVDLTWVANPVAEYPATG